MSSYTPFTNRKSVAFSNAGSLAEIIYTATKTVLVTVRLTGNAFSTDDANRIFVENISSTLDYVIAGNVERAGSTSSFPFIGSTVLTSGDVIKIDGPANPGSLQGTLYIFELD